MYSVESEHNALEQVAALPAEALPFYAELMTVLETAPWGGEAYDRQRPDGKLLWEAFSAAPPVWAHLPVIVNERRQKLSKRRDKMGLEDYSPTATCPVRSSTT